MQLLSFRSTPKTLRQYSAVREFVSIFVLVVAVGVGMIRLGTYLVVTKTNDSVASAPISFPIGVDPARKLIVENAELEDYLLGQAVSQLPDTPQSPIHWARRILAKLSLQSWYQNLASPASRILVILSGERKEEVAEHFGSILAWDTEERSEFIELVASSSPALSEGKFAPHTYITTRHASPAEVAVLVVEQFQEAILSRYTSSTDAIVPLQDALTIASLLEREGKDFDDMRQISGIIWNRLFSDMRLQLDATLQYAKGSMLNQPWWPKVVPADKQIASTFNTYKNTGLPPAPIANPALDAILAALNPKSTDCMFYFHDADGGFHCSVTYEEHVALLKEYY